MLAAVDRHVERATSSDETLRRYLRMALRFALIVVMICAGVAACLLVVAVSILYTASVTGLNPVVAGAVAGVGALGTSGSALVGISRWRHRRRARLTDGAGREEREG
ncbi:hypothetical protein [Kutzneria sp. NPDC051319]|uniref:hypothetical protein n=1 Tax=Kutzneria sp. NPDC051319 TaxID=3155047 RepID=UPI00343D1148